MEIKKMKDESFEVVAQHEVQGVRVTTEKRVEGFEKVQIMLSSQCEVDLLSKIVYIALKAGEELLSIDNAQEALLQLSDFFRPSRNVEKEVDDFFTESTRCSKSELAGLLTVSNGIDASGILASESGAIDARGLQQAETGGDTAAVNPQEERQENVEGLAV
jgi:hypothetical protein